MWVACKIMIIHFVLQSPIAQKNLQYLLITDLKQIKTIPIIEIKSNLVSTSTENYSILTHRKIKVHLKFTNINVLYTQRIN